MLCEWSQYHPESAKQLCVDPMAADIFCFSSDEEVKAAAAKAMQEFDILQPEPKHGMSGMVRRALQGLGNNVLSMDTMPECPSRHNVTVFKCHRR